MLIGTTSAWTYCGHRATILCCWWLFDQHLVDTLTFVGHDEGFSLEHTDDAPLPAFSLSVHVVGATASFNVTIDDFTLVELDSFTLDTEYNYDGTIVSDYGHYCSNDARAEVFATTTTGGSVWSTTNKMQIAPAAISQ